MHISVYAAVLYFVALVASAPVAIIPRQTCYSGVYIIAARGTTEAAGYGSIISVVNSVLNEIPGSGSIALDYPATYLIPIYSESVTKGIKTMISLIETYVDTCGGKIVLVGYSQGGNVITDILAGGVDKPAVLSSKYAAYITAITVFGDPSFTYGQSFDVGTDTTTNGIFARKQGGSSLALLNTYASIIQSYCDEGDEYCASGHNSTAHGQEISTWGNDAVNFIVKRST